MAQWQNCWRECWEAWGPEFNAMPGRVGVRFLNKLGQPPKTYTSYSLLTVTHLQGVVTLSVSYAFDFIIHAICVVCIYKKALLLICLSQPLKKGWRTLKNFFFQNVPSRLEVHLRSRAHQYHHPYNACCGRAIRYSRHS